MADLIAPGVQVTVTDNTITSASGNGTVPLFIIATAQDKLVSGSSSIAQGTVKANAGKLQLMTSQKNVLETFGNPIFQKHNGNVVQGDELNEYGLHALYSYMGIANRAYVLRADIDLSSLVPRPTEPTGTPPNGTVWIDTVNTTVEAYVSKTSAPSTFYDWAQKPVTFVSAEQLADVDTSKFKIDDVVIRHVPSTGQMLVYKYISIGLTQVDTTLSPINKVPTEEGIWIRDGFTKNGSQYFGTHFVVRRYASLTGVWNTIDAFTGNSFYEVEAKSGRFDSTYYAIKFDKDSNSFSAYSKTSSMPSVSDSIVPTMTGVAASDIIMTLKFLNRSVSAVAVKTGETITVPTIVANLQQSADLANAGFTFQSLNGLVISNRNGYSFIVGQNVPLFSDVSRLDTESRNYSLVRASSLFVQPDTPTAQAKEGTYWFYFSNSDSLEVGMYVANVQQNTWDLVTEDNKYVQLDEPAADRDFWAQPLSQGIDGYNFYRNIDGAWVKLDDTDQSTVNGMIFEDFVNGEVPAANLYQNDMLAIDLGTTEGVVKQMQSGKWVVVSGTSQNGAALFGRQAQRQMVVEAMAATIIGNEDIRAETIMFSLICAPGYVELLDEQITLNVDRRETAFIVTDVPARLVPSGSEIQDWATNKNNAPSNGDVGRVSAYNFAAQYMGWCLSTNVDGEEIAVPGSTVAMRTYAYSDSISYVWQPPAGTRNGIVTNASSVGFINQEGEYQPVVYNTGVRGVMNVNKINPIAMRPNRGLLLFGDKTLSPESTSALSSVNVARLVVYIRQQLEILAEPFIFQLNTPSVRQEFAGVVNSFLAEIVQLNGLYDFLVVCDSSNNTIDRINRLELWMDIAIVPTRSINYIYIPIRIEREITN